MAHGIKIKCCECKKIVSNLHHDTKGNVYCYFCKRAKTHTMPLVTDKVLIDKAFRKVFTTQEERHALEIPNMVHDKIEKDLNKRR